MPPLSNPSNFAAVTAPASSSAVGLVGSSRGFTVVGAQKKTLHRCLVVNSSNEAITITPVSNFPVRVLMEPLEATHPPAAASGGVTGARDDDVALSMSRYGFAELSTKSRQLQSLQGIKRSDLRVSPQLQVRER